MGIRFELRDQFDIVEIGEHKTLAAFKCVETEAAPEANQPRLGMAIGAPIAFFLAKLESSPHQLKGGAAFAEFLTNGEPFDFGEIGKKAHTQTAGRLVADIGDQMGRGEVVAVIFLVIGARPVRRYKRRCG